MQYFYLFLINSKYYYGIKTCIFIFAQNTYIITQWKMIIQLNWSVQRYLVVAFVEKNGFLILSFIYDFYVSVVDFYIGLDDFNLTSTCSASYCYRGFLTSQFCFHWWPFFVFFDCLTAMAAVIKNVLKTENKVYM